jgi:hypothetical protein
LGNEHDITVQAGRPRATLPLTRKFKEHWEGLLNSAMHAEDAAKRRHTEGANAAQLEPDNLVACRRHRALLVLQLQG